MENRKPRARRSNNHAQSREVALDLAIRAFRKIGEWNGDTGSGRYRIA